MYRKNTPIGYTKLRFFGIGKGFDLRPSAHDRTRLARPTHDRTRPVRPARSHRAHAAPYDLHDPHDRMHDRTFDLAFQRPWPVYNSHDPRGRTQPARPTRPTRPTRPARSHAACAFRTSACFTRLRATRPSFALKIDSRKRRSPVSGSSNREAVCLSKHQSHLLDA